MNHLSTLEDHELLELYIAGNATAFNTLFYRHRDRIFTCIQLLVKDAELSEDLFQDVFIRVINTISHNRYDEQGKFLPWVLRIARNICMDHFRRIKNIPLVKQPDDFDIFSTIGHSTASAEEKIVTLENECMVRQLLDQLPDDQREVIILRHYANLSFKEIATITNCSVNTALGRMRYGLINLRKRQVSVAA